nr:DUF1214 domain-containing protein [Paracoccus marinaquae]
MPNDAFWSITVYGSDAFTNSDNASISEGMAEMNEYGTVTVYFGSAEACGADKPNRIDITDGWNFLLRVCRPGQEVLDRAYVLPEVEEVAS